MKYDKNLDRDDDDIEDLDEESEDDYGNDFTPDEEDEELEDEEVEEEDEEEIEEEEPEPIKEPKIPKSRLDEVIAQREEARERNLWLEAQLEKLIGLSNTPPVQAKAKEPEPTYDFDAAEEQYATLLIDGEIAKASKLRSEISRQQQLQIKSLIESIKEGADETAKQSSSKAIEESRFSAAIEAFEVEYPFLDTSSSEYNEEAIETVNTLLAGYVAAGKTKTEALKLAVKKVVPMYTIEKPKSKTSLGEKRKVEAGKKAAAASKQQPTKTKPGSTRTSEAGKIDVLKMSDKDFAKLTLAEKKALRGD